MKRIIILILTVFLAANCVYARQKDIDINYSDGIYHIVLHGERVKKKIAAHAVTSLATNKEIHKQSKARLTVNGGFFDPENEKTISYVVINHQTYEDPMLNENLLTNNFLRKNLPKILNRTEFRVVDCDNQFSYEIVPHNTPVDFGCGIVHSIQAGPLILPELRLEEELFVVKEDGEVKRESCSVLHKTARTVLGLKNGELHILVITDENPMDLYEVQDLCIKFGFERAMAFDGGSSTSMNYKDKYDVVSLKGDGAGRRLKSFLLVY